MHIVVGVTGGIAAYKSAQLVRLFVKDGHEVHVVPTEDALPFVGTPTWEALSRNPVTTSVHEHVDRVRHVALGQAADLVVVAPATANTLAKMAAGIADSLLGTTLLATTAPVLVAPAMHTEMWRHPATQHNMRVLRERGVQVIGPEAGELTGGDSGEGRMTEPERIAERAAELFTANGLASATPQIPASPDTTAIPASRDRDLTGLRVAVSAGGTREPIDPVRFLGNRSSGRQGVAVALAAADRGAAVTLAASNISTDVIAPAHDHPGIRIVPAATAAELADVMRQASLAAEVVVMTAAVADFRPVSRADRKLTKEDGPPPAIELAETEDILAALVRERRAGQTIVGFAAETPVDRDDLLTRARRKRERKGVDLLAVNEVGWERGFEKGENAVMLMDASGEVAAETHGSKREVADAVWDAVIRLRD